MGKESPIWDNIDQTHESYNSCVTKIVENIGENGLLFMGSHNLGTLEMIQKLINNQNQHFRDNHQVRLG